MRVQAVRSLAVAAATAIGVSCAGSGPATHQGSSIGPRVTTSAVASATSDPGDGNVLRACEYLTAAGASSVLGSSSVQDTALSRGYANADFCTYRSVASRAWLLQFTIGTPDVPEYTRQHRNRQQDEPSVSPGAYSFVDGEGAHLLTTHFSQDASVRVDLGGSCSVNQQACLEGARKLMRSILAAYDSGRH
jgi:hypothetical protein